MTKQEIAAIKEFVSKVIIFSYNLSNANRERLAEAEQALDNLAEDK